MMRPFAAGITAIIILSSCRVAIPQKNLCTAKEFDRVARTLGEMKGKHDAVQIILKDSPYFSENDFKKRLGIVLFKYNCANMQYMKAVLVISRNIQETKECEAELQKALTMLKEADKELSSLLIALNERTKSIPARK